MNNYKEVIINKCWGGFGLSHEAMMLYAKLAGFQLYPIVEYRKPDGTKFGKMTNKFVPYHPKKIKDWELIFYSKKPLNSSGEYEDNSLFLDSDIERDDPILVKVVKELKEKANARLAELKIVNIPVDIEFTIEDYDGQEHIAEKHETWG